MEPVVGLRRDRIKRHWWVLPEAGHAECARLQEHSSLVVLRKTESFRVTGCTQTPLSHAACRDEHEISVRWTEIMVKPIQAFYDHKIKWGKVA